MKRFCLTGLVFAMALVFAPFCPSLYAEDAGSEPMQEADGPVSTDVIIDYEPPIVVKNAYLLKDESSKTTFRLFNPEEGINFLIDGSSFAEKNPGDFSRVELDRRYDVYIERIDEVSCLSAISGLRSSAEIEEDRRIAAEKRAWEEANRFDPNDFHFVSENFLPAMYSSVDLTSAMERSSSKDFNRGFYISDVTAVAQYGKAIYVKSQDLSASKVMTINGRGNIHENERVLIYYSLSKGDEDYVEWEISAIKILSAGS